MEQSTRKAHRSQLADKEVLHLQKFVSERATSQAALIIPLTTLDGASRIGIA